FLLSKTEFLYHLAGGGAQPNLSSNALKEKLLIPVPCPGNPQKSLEIQQKIVDILDRFTELTARKKQYNYYREKLLSFEEGEVEWIELGDTQYFEVSSGGTPNTTNPEYWQNGEIPWLKSESCNNTPVFAANNFITELGLRNS